MPDTNAAGQPVDPRAIPEPKPENARQAVAMTRDDHNWKLDRPELNSTDGIKRNITALWDALDRLAAYVDGDKGDEPAAVKAEPKSYQAPRDTQRPMTDFERNQQSAYGAAGQHTPSPIPAV